MISATSLNSGSSPHSLGKSPQIPLTLDNSRLRVDSQKFLVPALPVSARALTTPNDGATKRRSIINGTAAPPHHSNDHHQHQQQQQGHHPGGVPNQLNGLSRSYGGSIPMHPPPPSMLANSRKDLYHDDAHHHVVGIPSNPGNFHRSSVPIPCSSPSRASSASPSKSHSPSPTALSNGVASPYPPPPSMASGIPDIGLGSSAAAAAAAAAASRLYPGFALGPSHASAHLGPYYAAAAAAAASHSIPYPFIGAHSLHGNSYLENYHSSLLSGLPPPSLRSSHSPQSSRQQQQQHFLPPAPQLSPHLPPRSAPSAHHNSGSQESGDRYNSHSHHNNGNSHHVNTSHSNASNATRYMNNSASKQHHHHHQLHKGSLVGMPSSYSQHGHSGDAGSEKSAKSQQQQQQQVSHKPWLNIVGGPKTSFEVAKEAELYDTEKAMKEGHKYHFSSSEKNGREMGPKVQHNVTKLPNSFFPPSGIPSMPAHAMDYAHAVGLMDLKPNYHQDHNSNFSIFPPPSPKKRQSSGQWNFPGTKNELPSPSLPSSNSGMTINSNDSYNKYLNNTPLIKTTREISNNQPSISPLNYNNSPGSVGSNSSGASTLSIPHSPKSPFVMTPPSASKTAQQLHFQFPPPLKHVHNDMATKLSHSIASLSAPSTPSFLSPNQAPTAPLTPTALHPAPKSARSSSKAVNNSGASHPPLPAEKLPLIDAFHRGNLTQLPNGDLKRVEDLSIEDFIAAAKLHSDSVTIAHCTVISIQVDNHNSICKLILTTGSQNEQVIIETNAEQPFFVVGRGWSSSVPSRTEQKLRLPCSPLCVGDICITLRRNSSPTVMAVVNGNHKRGGRGSQSGPAKKPAAPRGATGRGRKGSASTAKNSSKEMPPPPPPPPTTTAAAAVSQLSTTSVQQGQPSSQLAQVQCDNQGGSSVKLDSKATTDGENVDDCDNDGPCSPKKRRWSAPEAINDENNCQGKPEA